MKSKKDINIGDKIHIVYMRHSDGINYSDLYTVLYRDYDYVMVISNKDVKYMISLTSVFAIGYD